MLSHADQTTKDMIERCFTLFQSRWQVMFHIFTCNGNGLVWTDDGKVIDPYIEEVRNNDMMHFVNRCSVDENDDVLNRHAVKDAAREMHITMVRFYQDNIDVIASTMNTMYFEPFISAPNYSSIEEFVRSPNYSLLGDAIRIKTANPEWGIEESWQKAINETIDAVSQLIYTEHFSYWTRDPVTCESAWADKKAFEVYHTLKEWRFELAPLNR